MPFVAEASSGDHVAPPQVGDDFRGTCPSCNGELGVRRSHERVGHFVARHFWHPAGRNGCSPGESTKHRRMKSVAASKAAARWPDADVDYEDVVEDRRADVLVRFDDPGRLGRGVAIEVQHRNEGKDVEATTNDFLDAGYSVLWLHDEHFDGKDVDLDAGDWRVWWAEQVPPPEDWTGFCGVIHWLRQTGYGSAPVEVKFNFNSDRWRGAVFGAWKRGYNTFGRNWFYYLRCQKCDRRIIRRDRPHRCVIYCSNCKKETSHYPGAGEVDANVSTLKHFSGLP